MFSFGAITIAPYAGFMRTLGGYYFYHNDALGTPQQLTAADGTVVWSAKAQAFGATSVDGGATVTNNLRLPGEYYDGETGLHYNWFRDYDPGIGRYVGWDLIGLAGGINLYTYVGGNPVSFADPFGLMKLPGEPSGLPPNWTPDPSHRAPNGERWRAPNGDDFVDFHKGQPGEPRWGGKDHWHHNGGKEHLPPGAEIPDPAPPQGSERSSCGGRCQKQWKQVFSAVLQTFIMTLVLVCVP